MFLVDQTKLVLGPDGRILFYNTQTGDTSTVCSYMWTNQGAGIVCRQLGLGDSGTAFYLPRDHNYTRNMYGLECMGSETSVYDCHYQLTDSYGSCEYTSDAGVECDSQGMFSLKVERKIILQEKLNSRLKILRQFQLNQKVVGSSYSHMLNAIKSDDLSNANNFQSNKKCHFLPFIVCRN